MHNKKFILHILVLLVIMLIISCSNDLIENSPANESVTITGDPNVAVSDTTATITFSTDKSVTVRVEYGTAENSLDKSTPQTETAGSTHSVALAGLQPATTYYYRIALYFGYAQPYKSTVYSFKTSLVGLTSDPQVTAGIDTATISFGTNASVTVLLEYGKSQTNLTSALPQTTTATTTHNLQLTSLVSETRYYYRIKLIRDNALVSTSSVYSFDTLASSSMLAIKRRGIWIIGGISGPNVNSVISQLDLYDPVTDTWYPDIASNATGTFTPVSFAAYAAYNDKLYVIGGFKEDGTCSNEVQIYDIANNSWSTGTVITAPRANIHAALYQGVIYIIGGTTGAASATFVAQNTTYAYNIGGNAWSSLLAPGALANRLSFAYGGVVYHLGGKSAATTYSNTHEGYVIATNAVTSGSTEVALSAARAGMAGLLISPSGKQSFMVVVGGISASTGTMWNFINQSTPTATFTNLVQYLHAPFCAPRTWMSQTNNFPVSIAFGALAYSPDTGYIYHFGGTQALGFVASGQASAYKIPLPPEPPSTWSNTWASISNMPRSRWGHGAVTFTN